MDQGRFVCRGCGGTGVVQRSDGRTVCTCPSCGMILHEGRLEVNGSNHKEVKEVAEALAKTAQEYIKVGEHLSSAKGLLYLIIGGTLIAALCFIAAGLVLVYLGATGQSTVELFGSTIKSENAGIVSIFFGAVTLIILFRQAMEKIEAILRIQRGFNDR